MKPTVMILRGIPGAGKSHFLLKQSRPFLDFSADNFWIDKGTGEYRFDPLRIGEAHADCFRRFLIALRIGGSGPWSAPLHIVDNTNIKSYEIAPYVLAASAAGLAHEIVTVWCNDPVLAFTRCVHKVPFKVILKMYADLLNEQLPTFWNHTVHIMGLPEGGK